MADSTHLRIRYNLCAFPNSLVLSYTHSGFAISVVTCDSLVIVDCSQHAPPNPPCVQA